VWKSASTIFFFFSFLLDSFPGKLTTHNTFFFFIFFIFFFSFLLQGGVPVDPAPIRGHRFGGPLMCVAWHPNQHLCALSSRGDGCPILLLEADRDKIDPDMALEVKFFIFFHEKKKKFKFSPTHLFFVFEFISSSRHLKL
jgi:hypothetical protein